MVLDYCFYYIFFSHLQPLAESPQATPNVHRRTYVAGVSKAEYALYPAYRSRHMRKSSLTT